MMRSLSINVECCSASTSCVESNTNDFSRLKLKSTNSRIIQKSFSSFFDLKISSKTIVSLLFIFLLTFPITSAAPVPIRKIDDSNDLSNDDHMTKLPRVHSRTRQLRRMLRSVELELSDRSTTESLTEETTPLRERRSEKKSYPRICYFSPIQCIFTREA